MILLQDKYAERGKRSNTQGQTPIPVVLEMIRLLQLTTQNKPGLTILEPTPGAGNIVKVLQDKFYDVTAPDDFFIYEREWCPGPGDQGDPYFDAIVMNPPFSTKTTDMTYCRNPEIKGLQVGYWMLERCMQMSNTLIALMPTWTISDSDHRRKRLEAFGLESITWLPRKTFNYTRVNTCILVLNKKHRGITTTRSFWY